MTDVRMMELAARQHRCVARRQLRDLGYSDRAVDHRIATGRLIALHDAVLAVAPAGDDDRLGWMAATLTAERTWLHLASAGNAFGFWPFVPPLPTVVRAGDGGPETLDGVRVFRSRLLAAETTALHGIPIVKPERVLIDLSVRSSPDRVARMVREAIRVGHTSAGDLLAAVRRHRGRRGTRKVFVAASRYAGLPLDRSRSDPEAAALGLFEQWGVTGYDHNKEVAGVEADFSFPEQRVIIEIDGPQFHLDAAEDARKQAIWEAAGWEVRRISSDDVYLRPWLLRALVPAANVGQSPL